MQLVEQQVIARGDPRYPPIDATAFALKNLWNAANYLVRQSFILEGTYLNNAPSIIRSKTTPPIRRSRAR